MERIAEKLPFLARDFDIPDDNGCEADEQNNAEYRVAKRQWRQYRCLWTIATICLCVLSAGFGAFVNLRWGHDALDQICLARASRGSPVTTDVKIQYHTIGFNGSLVKENIYRRKGSPEVDAAWAGLGVNYRSVLVPEAYGERAGLRSDQVKARGKYGGGFPANIEGLHQLHCLNLVRQALFYNIDYYRALGEGPFQNSEYILQKHISHCLDIIRQQLMCTVDIGVMGQVWFQPASAATPEAYVDFNTKHVCRNFEDIRQWAEQHQMPAEVPEDFLEPPRDGDRVYRVIP